MNMALVKETKKEAEVCGGRAAVSLGHHMLQVKEGITEILEILKPKAAAYMDSLNQVDRDKILRELYPDASVAEVPEIPRPVDPAPAPPKLHPEPRVYTDDERDEARRLYGIELP